MVRQILSQFLKKYMDPISTTLNVVFTFIMPLGFVEYPMTCAYVKLLGPCFKTGRIGGQLLH